MRRTPLRWLLWLGVLAFALVPPGQVCAQDEPPFRFTSPVAGDVLTIGSTWLITWTTTLPNWQVSILYCKDGVETTWGYYHVWNNGTAPVLITSAASPPGDGYQLKIVYGPDPSQYAFSEVFSVEGGPETIYATYGSVFKLYKAGLMAAPKVFLTDDAGSGRKSLKVLGFDAISVTCMLWTKAPPLWDAEQYELYPYTIWIQEKGKAAEEWSWEFYVAYPQFDSITYNGRDRIIVEGNYFGTAKPTVYMKFLYMHADDPPIGTAKFKVLEYSMERIVVAVPPGYIEGLWAEDVHQSNFYVRNKICENWDFFEF
jgi:hypothetical protein